MDRTPEHGEEFAFDAVDRGRRGEEKNLFTLGKGGGGFIGERRYHYLTLVYSGQFGIYPDVPAVAYVGVGNAHAQCQF